MIIITPNSQLGAKCFLLGAKYSQLEAKSSNIGAKFSQLEAKCSHLPRGQGGRAKYLFTYRFAALQYGDFLWQAHTVIIIIILLWQLLILMN